MKHNPATHPTFPLNDRSILNFNSIVSAGIDETPTDNNFTLVQTLVNSLDPNDKTCLQGNSIAPEMIGKYIDYLIRFENTGTAPANFIVVKDMIDTNIFDIETLKPVNSSHNYEITIKDGNKVEFYFEDINLPFNNEDNDGFIMFKIKTKPTLHVGDVLKNKVDIYFDYNLPVTTNEAQTKIENLNTEEFVDSNMKFTFLPNPAKDKITFSEEIKSVLIFDLTGKLIQSSIVNAKYMDISLLQKGNYIIKISTENKNITGKLIKE